MAEPFKKDGLSYFRDPSRGGALVSVPEGTEPSPLLVPVTQSELEADAKRADDESALGVATTFASRGLSGASALAQSAAKYSPLGTIAETGLSLLSPEERAALPLDPTNSSRPLWQQAAGLAGYSEKGLSEQEAELSKANPITGMAGEIFGQSFAPSGVGAAKGLLGKVGVGAVEGMGWGNLDAETQARLEGRGTPAAGERVAAMVIGGVVGGLTGGLVHGGGKALGSIGEMAGKKVPLADKVGGGGTDQGLLSKLAKTVGDAQVRFGGADEGVMAIGGIGSTHPERDLFREVVSNPQRTIKEEASRLGKALETTSEVEEQIHRYLGDAEGNEWRRDVVEDLMGDIDRVAARDAVGKSLVDLQKAIVAHLDEVDKAMALPRHVNANTAVIPHYNRLREFSTELAGIQESIAKPLGQGGMTAADAFVALNKLKRNAGEYAKRMPVSGASEVRIGGAGQLVDDLKEFIGSAETDSGIFRSVRDLLESEKVWGEAGALQREVNAGVHEFLGVSGKYNSELGNWVGKEYPSGRKIWKPDMAKMESAVSAVGKAPDGQFARDIGQRLNGLERTVDALRRMKAPGFENLDDAVKAIGEARATTADSVKRASWVEMYQEQMLGKQRKWDELGLTKPTTMGVMGAWAGGPIGAAAGLAGSMMFRPASTMNAAHQIRSMVNRNFGTALERGARAVVSGGETVAQKKAALIPKIVTKTPISSADLSRAATVGGIAAFLGGKKSMDQAYEERSKEIRLLAQDPTLIASRLADAAPGLSDDPELAAAAAETTTRAVQFLAQRLPKASSSAGMFDQQDPRPSRGDIQRWASDWVTAMNPLSTLVDAERGRLSQGQIETLKTLYPDIYAEISEHARDEAARYAAESKIPYRIKNQLDVLLGLGGAGVPQLSPSTSREILGSLRAKHGRGGATKNVNMAQSVETQDASWPSMK